MCSNMTCQENQIPNDGPNSAALYTFLLIRFVFQRLLTNHAEQVVCNDSQLKDQFIGFKLP